MRNITKALIVLMLLVPQAQSRVTILPSDNTGGGGGSKLGLTWLGTDVAPWAIANLPACMSTVLSDPVTFCDNAAATGIPAHLWHVYSGRPVVTELVCSSSTSISATSTYTLQLAYRDEAGTRLTFFPGSLVFTAATSPGASQTLAINARPTISDGFFVVTIDSVVQDAADVATALRIACTVN